MNTIIQSLIDHPEDWCQDTYELRHRSGIRVWTANGCCHYGIRGCKWGWRERRAFHRAYKKWQQTVPIEYHHKHKALP